MTAAPNPARRRATVWLPGTPREYVVDPETLREVPTRPAALAAWLEVARDAPIPTDPVAERRHRTDIGVAARMAGELDLAEQQLFVAAELARRESRTAALRARLRLAHVWQWQRRFPSATEAFDTCVTAAATPIDRALAHQYAGRGAYDMNDFEGAMGHFHAALRLRVDSGADRELTESCRLALDAADACRVGVEVATELARLMSDAHRRIRDVLLTGDLLLDRPPRLGPLVELRGPLLAGPVSRHVVTGLFDYRPGVEQDIADLVTAGWLVRSRAAVAPTARCSALLETVMTAAGTALRDAWGRPEAALARVDAVVRSATGTSAGPVFDALASVDPQGSSAVRLFERCDALRHHRADAHAAAWRAVGLSPTAWTDVPADDPVHQHVASVTNRVASRPYRPLSAVDRTELVAALRRLPRDVQWRVQ